MIYRLKGRLCGYLCDDCPEPLAHLTVRLYRLAKDQPAAALAVAQTKETFAVLDAAAVQAKAARLLGEFETDADGVFLAELTAEKGGYAGEAFEIDVYCPTVPHRKPTPKPPQPLQFSVTTHQPLWRRTEQGFLAAWGQCLPKRLWCHIRGLFDAWVICGRVTVCTTKEPVGGVRVKAFDVDWLQDDALGEAVTDAQGHFRIDYTSVDFRRDIFGLNIELIGGPDLYFKIESIPDGLPLLVEAPSRGRDSDREDVGPCFCVDLCLKDEPPPGTTDLPPAFLALGGYEFATDLVAATGLTVGDGRAFYRTVRLNGVLPQKKNAHPLEYRFEVRGTTATGAPIGGWTPVLPAQIAPTPIGRLLTFAPAFPGDPNPIKSRPVVVNGGGPGVVAITVDADGWIAVPQENNVFAPSGAFAASGDQLGLLTPTLAAFGQRDLTGVVAGASSTSGGTALAQHRHFALRMVVRERTGPLPGDVTAAVGAGECSHVAINNTTYTNVSHHPSWNPFTETEALGVCLLDLQELLAAGCAGVTDTLTPRFTAAHPTLGAVAMTLTGPNGPLPLVLPPAVPGERFGTATPPVAPDPQAWTVADLPNCAYILTLSVQLLLTTGDSAPLPLQDQVAFCKHDAD